MVLENQLNKHQLEIIKLFKRDLNNNDLVEINKLIIQYLGNKVTRLVDDV